MYSVVILSRDATNLERCVTAALEAEHPSLSSQHIIVLDDDEETGAVKKICTRFNLTRIVGEKPFIFARNANAGLRHAFERHNHDYAVLLNDDALLMTQNGFRVLVSQGMSNPQYGVLASCTNSVGNANQLPQGCSHIRREYRTLCFVCVMISKACWQTIGPLDERYVDYGVEDGDYSYRVRLGGMRLGVVDHCYVDHGQLKSTFRSVGGGRSFAKNRKIFEEKWGFAYESQ
jgi:GT2 family glycosyltransferase